MTGSLGNSFRSILAGELVSHWAVTGRVESQVGPQILKGFRFGRNGDMGT